MTYKMSIGDAVILYYEGSYQEAMDIFIQLNDTKYTAKCYFYLRNYEKALEFFNQLADDFEINFFKGQCYFHLKDYHTALLFFNKSSCEENSYFEDECRKHLTPTTKKYVELKVEEFSQKNISESKIIQKYQEQNECLKVTTPTTENYMELKVAEKSLPKNISESKVSEEYLEQNEFLPTLELKDNRLIITTSSVIHIYKDNQVEFTLNQHTDVITSMCLLGDNRFISGSRDKQIIVWNLEQECSPVEYISSEDDWINYLLPYEDGFISGTRNIKIWTPEYMVRLNTSGCVEFMVISVNQLIISTKHHYLEIWDLSTYERIYQSQQYNYSIPKILILPNGDCVFRQVDHLIVWNFKTEIKLKSHDTSVIRGFGVIKGKIYTLKFGSIEIWTNEKWDTINICGSGICQLFNDKFYICDRFANICTEDGDKISTHVSDNHVETFQILINGQVVLRIVESKRLVKGRSFISPITGWIDYIIHTFKKYKLIFICTPENMGQIKI